MTVKELIEKLQSFGPDMEDKPVCVSVDYMTTTPISECDTAVGPKGPYVYIF